MKTKFSDYVAKSDAAASDDQRALGAAFEAHFVAEQRAHFGFSHALVVARKAAGLNQQQLADLTGINQSEISRIERGQGNPTLDTLERLTGPLHVHLAIVDEAGHPLEMA